MISNIDVEYDNVTSDEEENECEMCLMDFKSEKHKHRCNTCNAKFCRDCIKKYMLTQYELPHCPSCKSKWDKQFFEKAVTKSFVNGKYKEYRKKILFDNETAKLPMTMPAVEKHVELTKLTNQRKLLKIEIKNKNEIIRKNYYYLISKLIINDPDFNEKEIESHPLFISQKSIKTQPWISYEKLNTTTKKNKYIYYSAFRLPYSDNNFEFYKKRHPEREYGINNYLFNNNSNNYYAWKKKRYLSDYESYNVKGKILPMDEAITQFKISVQELFKNNHKNIYKINEKIYELYFNTNMMYNLRYNEFLVFVRNYTDKIYDTVRLHMKYNTQLQKMYSQQTKLQNSLWSLKYGTKKKVVDKREFIQKCGRENCRGFLSKNWKCSICGYETCSKCLEVKPLIKKDSKGICEHNHEPHVCDPEKVKSIALIKKETVKCPSCATPIFKISGCDQMWCTSCNIAFNWRTGRKIKGIIHNPHYFEWKAKEGSKIRQPHEIVCGGLPNFGSLRFYITKHIGYLNGQFQELSNLYRGVNHIQDEELRKLRYKCNRAGADNNEDIRIKYILKDYDEKGLKRVLLSRDKAINKATCVMHIYEMMNTIFIESLNDIYAVATDPQNKKVNKENTLNIKNNLQKNLDRCRKVREYGNKELLKISKDFNNVVPLLDEKYYIKTRKFKK